MYLLLFIYLCLFIVRTRSEAFCIFALYKCLFIIIIITVALLLPYRMASRVLLATLAIPISPPRNDIGDMLDMGNTTMENQRKLANLLGLQNPSSRVQLVKDLVSQPAVMDMECKQ